MTLAASEGFLSFFSAAERAVEVELEEVEEEAFLGGGLGRSLRPCCCFLSLFLCCSSPMAAWGKWWWIVNVGHVRHDKWSGSDGGW